MNSILRIYVPSTLNVAIQHTKVLIGLDLYFTQYFGSIFLKWKKEMQKPNMFFLKQKLCLFGNNLPSNRSVLLIGQT